VGLFSFCGSLVLHCTEFSRGLREGKIVEVRTQENPPVTPDQALDRLKAFLIEKNHLSVLELSGISPETFKIIQRRIQDDGQQFPGFENAQSVNFMEAGDDFYST